MRDLTTEEIERKWPKLRGNHAVASRSTRRYNCVAFAAGDERHWWEAGMYGGQYHWPEKTPDTLDGWVEIFKRQNFELTSNRDVEPGFEKIAIYTDLEDMRPGHVAISDGRVWKSKLGRFQDIEHVSIDALEGDQNCEYGIVEEILRRPIQKSKMKRQSRETSARA